MQITIRDVIKFFTLGTFLCLLFLLPNNSYAAEVSPEKIIELVNNERANYQLQPLTANSKLISAANEKLDDMMDKNYFDHRSPDGKLPWDFITNSSYDYKFAGENLAIDYNSAEKVVSAWLDSLAHRKNILDTRFKDIGIAVKSNNEHVYIVQLFGSQVLQTESVKIVASDIPTEDSPTNANDVPIVHSDKPVEPILIDSTIISNLITHENSQETANQQKVLGISKKSNNSLDAIVYIFTACYLLIIVLTTIWIFEDKYENQIIITTEE